MVRDLGFPGSWTLVFRIFSPSGLKFLFPSCFTGDNRLHFPPFFFFFHAPYFGIISTTFPMARACLPCLPLSLLLRLTPSYGASIPIQHHRHAPFISLPTFLAHRSRRLTLIQCFSIVPSHSVRLLFLLSQTIDYHTYLTWRCIAITSIHPGPLDLKSAYNHARRFGWQIPEW